MKSRRAQHAFVILFYTLLAFLLLGPLKPTQEVWGYKSDVVNHLYLLSWQAEEAAKGNPFPMRNRELHYPDGGRIWLVDPVGGLLAAPAARLFGGVAAYNLMILGDLVFACWAMFWLVRRRTGDAWTAFLAGGIFGLSPFMFANVNNGLTESLQAGWLPLFAGVLLELRDDIHNGRWTKRTWTLVSFSAFAWWTATLAGHWYYGVFAGMIFALPVIAAAFQRDRWITLSRFSAVFILYVLLILPVALAFYRYLHSADILTRGEHIGFGVRVFKNFACADPAHFFSPRAAYGSYQHIAYVGVATLALALSGLFRHAHALKRKILGWIGAAVFFSVLAIGPNPFFNDNPLSFPPSTFMPFGWLLTLPFSEGLNFPWRFILLTHLCLALAAGFSLANRWEHSRARGAFYLMMLAAVIAETALNSGARVPAWHESLRAPEPIRKLASMTPSGAVFDLPVNVTQDILNQYVADKIIHRRPILYSNFSVNPHPFPMSLARDSLLFNVFAVGDDRALLGGFLGKEARAREILGCLSADRPCGRDLVDELDEDIERLEALGITAVVLHHQFLPKRSILPEVCRRLFGPPSDEDRKVAVFRMRKSAEPSASF